MSEKYEGPVVDIWTRPPFGGFLSTPMYRDKQRINDKFAVRGFLPSTVLQSESLDQMIEEMDAGRIALAVAPVRRGGRLGEVSNDDVEALVDGHPDRFLGFAQPDLADLDAGLREARAALAKPQFAGLVLEPGLWKPARYVDDRVFYPFYEAAGAAGKPVMLLVGGNGGPDVSYCNSEPVDRVALDFPDLTVVMQHGGWPRVGDALNLAYRRSNVYLSPDVYIQRMFGWRDLVDAAHTYLQDRILFGSGYPFSTYDYSVPQLSQWLEPEFGEKLFFRNACTLLNLDPATVAAALPSVPA